MLRYTMLLSAALLCLTGKVAAQEARPAALRLLPASVLDSTDRPVQDVKSATALRSKYIKTGAVVGGVSGGLIFALMGHSHATVICAWTFDPTCKQDAALPMTLAYSAMGMLSGALTGAVIGRLWPLPSTDVSSDVKSKE